jgi:anaerobic magnesium-protoporphyrin IX monomethyl ester cyclase
MVNKDIIFILSPKCEVVHPPLNIACLSAYLRKNCFSVGVYDLNVQCYLNRGEKYKTHWEVTSQEFWTLAGAVEGYFNDNENLITELLAYLRQECPFAVGFTNWFVNFEANIYIARIIKKVFPHIKVIFGGPEISIRFKANSLDSKECMAVDAFVIGEGELTLEELLRRYKNGENDATCPGAADNQLRMVSERKSITDLSILPGPDYSDFNFEHYSAKGKVLATYFSRGCVNKCIYCDERAFWGTYKTKRGGQCYEEIKELKKSYPQLYHVTVNDSLVNGNIKELTEFCRLMTQNHLRVSWDVNAIIRKEMDENLLQLMKNAGCSRLIYGIESVSHAVLENIGKVMSRECDIEKIVRDTASAGIEVWTNFMFGLPGETDDDAKANIDFVLRNKEYIHTVAPTFAFCNLSEFSGAHLNPKKYGIKKDVHICFWESEDGTNNFQVRLERFERFSRAINSAGMRSIYPHDTLLDRDRKLGHYFFYKKDFNAARESFERAYAKEPWDKSLEDTLNQLIKIIAIDQNPVDCPTEHTDENWLNGVARSWATAFFVANTTRVKKEMAVGNKITFADGTARRIVNTKEDGTSLIIFLSGDPLDGAVVGYPRKFTVHSPAEVSI